MENFNIPSNKTFGVIVTLIGGILWGFSGVCGQYLFTKKGISSDWLVPYRLLFAGITLVIFYAIKNPKNFISPILDYGLSLHLLVYAILGLMLTQYSYFYSIELSNAAVATVIQYSAPALILAIICIYNKRLPNLNELTALVLSAIGVLLLATHGNFNSLVISSKALFYCLVSAICVCIYNLAPIKLNQKYPVGLNLGCGMIIGGIILACITQAWNLDGVKDTEGILAFICIIFFGTVLAFSLYMTGVKLIGASKASLIACIEPVSAAIISYIWLEIKFIFIDFIGFVLIISCIFLLSKTDKRRKNENFN